MTALLTADEAARLRPGERLVIVRAGDQRPSEPVGGTCDWGDCQFWAITRRWSDGHGWLPVCEKHADRYGVAPPPLWVALTGPCPTCVGKAVHLKSVAIGSHRYASECSLCETDGHMHMWDCPNHPRNSDSGTRNDVESPSGGLRATGVAKSTDGRPAVVSPWRVPCPPGQCLGLPGCDGVQCTADPCPDCRDGRRIEPLYAECPEPFRRHIPPCPACNNEGRVLVGRGSIEVVPVVDRADTQFHRFLRSHICIDTRLRESLYADSDSETALALDPLPVPGRDFGVVIDCVEVAP